MRLRLAIELLGFLVLAGLIALVPQLVDGFTAYEFGIAGTFFITLLGLAILPVWPGCSSGFRRCGSPVSISR